MLNTFRLSTRIFLLGIAIVVLSSLVFLYIYPNTKAKILNSKYTETRHVVESVWGILDYYAKLVDSNAMSAEEGKQRALDVVRALRYEKENYFWINDMEPRMVMHPIKKELDGQILTNSKDPNGKALFCEMVEVVKRDGAGFVQYYWPKPGHVQPVPKISYVKGFPKWGWVIGSGIYINDVESEMRQMLWIILAAIITASVGGLLLVFFVARSISHPIYRVMHKLGDTAGLVSSASSQVSAASQSLAEGAAQNASGLEETSATMEEMASMTKLNADNANQANKIMQDTSLAVDDASIAMKELTQSMNEISEASQETAKIIRTIDEIAFQTNLLALNAAVEAARAGETGAGFAVVADEVRNLAMRASEAAKNTTGLIEGTINKMKKGSDAVARTNEAFEKVASGSKQIGELISGITIASQEQAQGIEQINTAIAEMDKVIQQNADIAETAASASGEMSTQAMFMKGFVQDLVTVVAGNRGPVIQRGARVVKDKKIRAERKQFSSVAPALAARRHNAKLNNGNKSLKPVSPKTDQVIHISKNSNTFDF